MVKYSTDVIDMISKIIEDLEYTQGELEDDCKLIEIEHMQLIDANHGHVIRKVLLSISMGVNGFLMVALILYTTQMKTMCNLTF